MPRRRLSSRRNPVATRRPSTVKNSCVGTGSGPTWNSTGNISFTVRLDSGRAEGQGRGRDVRPFPGTAHPVGRMGHAASRSGTAWSGLGLAAGRPHGCRAPRGRLGSAVAVRPAGPDGRHRSSPRPRRVRPDGPRDPRAGAVLRGPPWPRRERPARDHGHLRARPASDLRRLDPDGVGLRGGPVTVGDPGRGAAHARTPGEDALSRSGSWLPATRTTTSTAPACPGGSFRGCGGHRRAWGRALPREGSPAAAPCGGQGRPPQAW